MKRLLIFFLLFCTTIVCSQADKGIISGKVIDYETQKPLSDADITIIELNKSIKSDSFGLFEFSDIPFSSYTIKVSLKGYEPKAQTDIVVLSARPTFVDIELNPQSYTTETIEVEAKYFEKSPDVNTSNFNFDFEEVRRAPGAVEDISRMVQGLSGVSTSNDQRSDIIVRGGSPSENLIIIDGIEIPNINHYPTQASTGGPIGMINVKFINDVNFSTGGFSARYGDKLSSIMDIKFREGSKQKLLFDINLSTAGFGGVLEGPLFTQKGSFLFSVRKSYLNLIKGAIRMASVPDYWDFNLKANYVFNSKNSLTVVGIGGIDYISFQGDDANISDDNPYGKATGDQKQFTLGASLKTLIKNGYLQNSIGNSSSWYDFTNYDIRNNNLLFDYKSKEYEYSIKSELFYQISKHQNIITGFNAKYIQVKNNIFLAADTSDFGDILPEYLLNNKSNFYKLGGFAQYTLKLFKDKFIINTGIRFDYFSGTAADINKVFSPRIGMSYKINDLTTINASTGIYYQAPEYLWVTTDPQNVNLKYVKAYHYILGVEHLFSDDLRMSLEVYYKDYKNYPVSFYIPTYILVNGGAENGPNFVGAANSNGYGFTRGIDFTLQKKLTGNGFYGMINYSLLESKVTATAGGEVPGSFDYRHNLVIIAGYQISNDWLIGIKYRYTSGRPFTPYDVTASAIANRGTLQYDKFNSERYKNYSRLDIRVDKKWNFNKLSIVCYVELQNVFNTTNIYQYFWNKYKNEQGTIYQWAFLPVGGFSIQF